MLKNVKSIQVAIFLVISFTIKIMTLDSSGHVSAHV